MNFKKGDRVYYSHYNCDATVLTGDIQEIGGIPCIRLILDDKSDPSYYNWLASVKFITLIPEKLTKHRLGVK